MGLTACVSIMEDVLRENESKEDSNWEADYPEIQTDLRVGTTTSGIFFQQSI